MTNIKLDELNSVTGGAGTAALRNALKVIKHPPHGSPFDVGVALGKADGTLTVGLKNSAAAFEKARAWLGGNSLNGHIDVALSRARFGVQ